MSKLSDLVVLNEKIACSPFPPGVADPAGKGGFVSSKKNTVIILRVLSRTSESFKTCVVIDGSHCKSLWATQKLYWPGTEEEFILVPLSAVIGFI